MTTVAMPCAARAALSEFAADAKALLVMMTRFAALDVAFQVEGSFQWIAAGAITPSSANAKIGRVPEPVVAKETCFVPSEALPIVPSMSVGLSGSVASTTRMAVDVKPVTVTALPPSSVHLREIGRAHV